MVQAAGAAAAQRLKHRFEKVDPIAAKQAPAAAEFSKDAHVSDGPTFRKECAGAS
jgi:hypothetical protein